MIAVLAMSLLMSFIACPLVLESLALRYRAFCSSSCSREFAPLSFRRLSRLFLRWRNMPVYFDGGLRYCPADRLLFRFERSGILLVVRIGEPQFAK